MFYLPDFLLKFSYMIICNISYAKQTFKSEEIKIYMLYKKVIRIMFRMPSAKYRDGSINVRISQMIVLMLYNE